MENRIDINGFVPPVEKQDINASKIPNHFTQYDLMGMDYNKNISLEGLQDLILVHKTDYIPQNSEIRTAQNSGVESNLNIQILGKTYEYKLPTHRNTLHFSVNGEVGDHSMGTWSDSKYAVLMPFTDIPIGSIGSAAPMDTFVIDNVQVTPNAYILCPKEDLEIVKSQNPSAKIITYEGNSVSGFADLLISKLGRKVESCGMWGWSDKADNEKYLDIIQKAGIDKWAPHSHTKLFEQEDRISRLERAVAILGITNNKHLMQNDEDFIKTRDELMIISPLVSDLSIFLTEGQISDVYDLPIVNKKIDTIIESLESIDITLNDFEKTLLHNVVNTSDNDMDNYSKKSVSLNKNDIRNNIDFVLEVNELIKTDYGFDETSEEQKKRLKEDIDIGFYPKDGYIPFVKDNTRSEFLARVISLASFSAIKRDYLPRHKLHISA